MTVSVRHFDGSIGELQVRQFPVNRVCPLAEQPAVQTLGWASAASIAAQNPTYRDDYAQILGISPDDEFPFVVGPTGFVYAGWLPPDDFLARVYEDVIDHSRTITTTMAYRQALLELASSFFRLVAERRTGSTQLRLLDFGCGYGALLDIMASKEIISTGYEPSLQRSIRAVKDGSFSVLASLDEVRLAAPFDLIVCTEVLEHVPDPREILKLLKDIAEPSALLALTVPQVEEREVLDMMVKLGSGKELPKVFNPWEHLNYFSAEKLRNLLEDCGFKVVRDYGSGLPTAAEASFIGKESGFRQQIKTSARLFKRSLFRKPSTQLFCQC
ncbi:class I SAM-dependent methyltransferase [Microbaculum marinum]|uniref:Class I SAM-dependent methyltransferase n=1 Tax=Microbaculum marinum TaxID=1764581 RepID=A0AAW9RGI3_9HYPH